LVIPILGYPGIQLSGTTIKENLTNPNAQFDTIAALASRFSPDVMLFLMDLTVEAEALGAEIMFPEDAPPSVTAPCVSSEGDLKKCRIPVPEEDGRMPVFLNTMRQMKKHLPMAKAAFVTGPFNFGRSHCGSRKCSQRYAKGSTLCKEAP
jgi:uroporphyrinogen decarboxylase